jgi:hypothetical protein
VRFSDAVPLFVNVSRALLARSSAAWEGSIPSSPGDSRRIYISNRSNPIDLVERAAPECFLDVLAFQEIMRKAELDITGLVENLYFIFRKPKLGGMRVNITLCCTQQQAGAVCARASKSRGSEYRTLR